MNTEDVGKSMTEAVLNYGNDMFLERDDDKASRLPREADYLGTVRIYRLERVSSEYGGIRTKATDAIVYRVELNSLLVWICLDEENNL